MVNTLRWAPCPRAWRLHFLVCVLFLSGAGACAAELSVAVEPNPPQQGESFRLAFSFEGALSDAPDFSVLDDDFEILGRNEQNAVTFVNGKYTRKTTWVLEVLPRGTGPIRIPAVRIGDAESKAFTLQARPDPAVNGRDDGLFLEVEAVPSSPYVQQEVRYTVRLWRRYELSNASLSEPELSADAIVKPVGGDRQYAMTRDGRRYDVVERSYLIYPQASGEVTIRPVRVTAQVLERATSLFEMLGRAVKTRRVDSEPVTLTVRPIPAAFPAGAQWLPARRVRLNELWTPESGPTRVGEPLSRTLSLWASGVTSGQLPTLVPKPVPGLKQYPDEPQRQDTLQDGEQNAVRQEKVAHVADRAGMWELPAIAIPWWNTDTDALEYAELPSRRMQVESLPGLEASPVPPPGPAPAQATKSAPATDEDASPASWRRWPGWFEVAVFTFLAWMASTFWLLHKRPRAEAGHRAENTELPTAESASRALALVEAACAADDSAAAHRALLVWAAAIWPEDPPLTLGAIARRVDPPLETVLADLDRACHGPARNRWQGGDLARTLRAVRLPPHEAQRKAAGDSLPRMFRLSGARRV